MSSTDGTSTQTSLLSQIAEALTAQNRTIDPELWYDYKDAIARLQMPDKAKDTFRRLVRDAIADPGVIWFSEQNCTLQGEAVIRFGRQAAAKHIGRLQGRSRKHDTQVER